MKVTILGSGSAYGLPFAGGFWGECDPQNPKNRRTTPSILIEEKDTKLLVDMGPDIRIQADRHHIQDVDGVFFTHGHFDHIGGMGHLPGLMVYYQDKHLPLYADRRTRKNIERNWWYLFDPAINVQYYGPGRPYWNEILPYESFSVKDLTILPFEQQHGGMGSMGLRIGNFAYSTDVRSFPEKSWAQLESLDVWVVECNNPTDTDKGHSYLAQTLGWIKELQPKQAYITHLDHTMDYESISSQLPAGVALAYDGMEIEI